MQQEFFRKILPTQGLYCAVAIPPGEKPLQRFVTTLDELLDLTSDTEGLNVYVAPNTFDGHSRVSEHAQWARSFFVDLDVGPGKGYDTKNDAYVALTHFAQDAGLPDPAIVDSGNGIHGYWAFDADVPIDEWRPYAKKFKQFCIDRGLRIDAAVTADASRIMRCPGTLNYKTTPPKPSVVMTEPIYQYSFTEFKEFLGPLTNGHDVLASAHRGLDEMTRALTRADNQQTLFEDLARKSLEGAGCAQIKYILENAADPELLKYPLWMAGLSIAARCDDAATAIHLMSEDHPAYDRENTEFKARETLKASGPHMCATFDTLNPGACDGCPHKGNLSPQSPIALARSVKLAPTTGDTPVQDAPAVFPAGLAPYQRGANGGIYFCPSGEDEQPVLILPYDLYARKRIYNATFGDCLEMVYATPHDGERVFLLNVKDVYSIEKLSEAVLKHGVAPDPANMKHLINYLVRWVRYMVGDKRAEDMRMQMGFTEDYMSFVIGDREYTSTGEERESPASPYVRSVAKLMVAEGQFADWQRAAKELDLPGMELHAFTMLCGFGSPLMWMTSTSGGCISLHGTTGAAKTGSLYGALSIWGSPKPLSVFEATSNGGVQRMLALHNIPLGRDEASNMDPILLSNLIHNISSGKAKIRLQSNVNAERELELPSSQLAIFTSNHALHERLQLKKASPEGEMARLIEFSLEELPAVIANDPARAKAIFDTFRTCYGHAGPLFIKHIYKIGFDAVRERLKHWQGRFLATFGNNSAYRFYENIIAAAFTGGELANDAGITQFELGHIYDAVMERVCVIRDTLRLNEVDHDAVVAEYIHRYGQNFLIFDGDRVLQEPRGELRGRIEVHNQIQYVNRKMFREHLLTLQLNTKEFETSATKAKLMSKNTKVRLSSGWKAGMGTAPVWAYGFKADIALDDVIKDATTDAAR